MLVVDLLSATSSFVCAIAPTPSTGAPSLQPMLITFTEAAISNSKNNYAALKYQCTDAFFFTVDSTGAKDTFAQTLLELLCISAEQSDISLTLSVHSIGLTSGIEFSCN
jgi:hypothetical protein